MRWEAWADATSGAPLVSVIVIFLNVEKYIREAIESIRAQTFGSWELLLVDDGSHDASPTIALQYAEQHPGQVRYLQHPGHQNRGMSASRNLGVRQARGKYIAFLDADDVLVPHALAEQVAILDAHRDAAMVYGPIRWWYSWTGQLADRDRDFVERLGVQPNTVIRPPALLRLFLQDQAAVPSGMLVRRVMFERVGGFEDSFRDLYEDQVFCAKVCLHEPVFASDRCWHWYRQHPEATCAIGQQTGRYYAARPTFLRWLESYLKQQRIDDVGVRRALDQELWPYRHPLMHWLRRHAQWALQWSQALALGAARRALSDPVRRRLWDAWQTYRGVPPVGRMRWGALRRVTPISRDWGYDRGTPIDRYYIERFLETYAYDIRGRVLEIAEDTYTRQVGRERVVRSDVLHVVEGDPRATLIGDLANGDHLPSDAFDCVILTQTLQLIYDVRAALRTIYRMLKPGGVLLATMPGISQISRYDMDRWGDYWRFTTQSARRLVSEVFPATHVCVAGRGNVLAAIAFLQGLASQELRQEELDYCDPDYELVITIRAVKPAPPAEAPSAAGGAD